MTPQVSVVMAAKNYARFLPTAVASVQAQSFADWELIIINDGSTDETHPIVQLLLNDDRIKYVLADRLGQSRAKNLGVRLARGKYIAFLDADDAWHPNKLARQMPLFQGNVGVVHCDREWIDEAGTIITPTATMTHHTNITMDDIYIRNPICFSSTVVLKDVFDRVGGFDPELDLSIDYDLWLRVARHYDFAHVPERLVHYRTGHGNLSKRLADRIATAFNIMHRHRAGIDDRKLNEAYAMTWRSRAWANRGHGHWAALKAYWHALRYPHRRGESVRGLAGVVKDMACGRGGLAVAENMSVNR